MTDDELKAEFIRVTREPGKTQIDAYVIEWPEPHTPTHRWAPAAVLALSATEQDIAAVIEAVLRDKRFFRVCKRCHTRNPGGWMHSKTICQSCVERHLGVVY